MRRSSLTATTLVALILTATGCGGDDEPATTLTTTSVASIVDTSPVFTEDTSNSTGEPAGTSETDAADTTTPEAGSAVAETPETTTTPAADTPTTQAVDGTNTTIAQDDSSTTVATTADTAGTTIAAASTDDFVVAAGTTDADGPVEPTIEVRVRSGASGEVVVPVNRILNIVVPGPTEWDLDELPDEAVLEDIDVVDVEDDDPGDPFPEAGGAVIITLRPLVAATTTLRVVSFDGPGDPITINVNAV